MSLRHRVRLDFSNFSDTTEVVYAEFICEKNAQIMAPTPRLFHFNSVGTSQQPILSRIAQKLELIPSDSSDQPIAAQYIWIGDSDMRLSSNSAMSDPSALPDLAPGNYREVILRYGFPFIVTSLVSFDRNLVRSVGHVQCPSIFQGPSWAPQRYPGLVRRLLYSSWSADPNKQEA